MIYAKDCLIDAATPATNPSHDVLNVTRGLVYKVEVEFPPGCAGLVHLAIFDGGHQAWPSSAGTDFHTDGFTISFDDTYLKLAAPYQFDIYGYSAGTLHNHTIQVRVGLVSSEIFMARFLPTYTWKYFKQMMGDLQKEQAALRAAAAAAPFGWIQD